MAGSRQNILEMRQKCVSLLKRERNFRSSQTCRAFFISLKCCSMNSKQLFADIGKKIFPPIEFNDTWAGFSLTVAEKSQSQKPPLEQSRISPPRLCALCSIPSWTRATSAFPRSRTKPNVILRRRKRGENNFLRMQHTVLCRCRGLFAQEARGNENKRNKHPDTHMHPGRDRLHTNQSEILLSHGVNPSKKRDSSDAAWKSLRKAKHVERRGMPEKC